jgi:hypothetical protein
MRVNLKRVLDGERWRAIRAATAAKIISAVKSDGGSFELDWFDPDTAVPVRRAG